MKHTITAIAGTLLLLSGCGYKNDPVPPQSVVPMAIEDLRYEIDGNSVKLSWSYPVETIKGGALTDISSFLLYRAGIPLEEYCKTCPVPFGTPQELPGGANYDGNQRRIAVFTSTEITPGYKYFFKVASRTGWLAASPDSNIVSFVYTTPPGKPANLTGEANDNAVTLRWQAVKKLANGAPLSGEVQYQVLRNGTRIGRLSPETSYTDTQIENGHIYSYAVQAVMDYSGEPINGSPCSAISLQPRDTTAPNAPTGAQAVTTSEGVKIFWDTVNGDISEYRIYRRANGEEAYKPIGTVESIYTIYTDDSASSEILYQYVVTAVDQAGNESIQSQPVSPRN